MSDDLRSPAERRQDDDFQGSTGRRSFDPPVDEDGEFDDDDDDESTGSGTSTSSSSTSSSTSSISKSSSSSSSRNTEQEQDFDPDEVGADTLDENQLERAADMGFEDDLERASRDGRGIGASREVEIREALREDSIQQLQDSSSTSSTSSSSSRNTQQEQQEEFDLNNPEDLQEIVGDELGRNAAADLRAAERRNQTLQDLPPATQRSVEEALRERAESEQVRDQIEEFAESSRERDQEEFEARQEARENENIQIETGPGGQFQLNQEPITESTTQQSKLGIEQSSSTSQEGEINLGAEIPEISSSDPEERVREMRNIADERDDLELIQTGDEQFTLQQTEESLIDEMAEIAGEQDDITLTTDEDGELILEERITTEQEIPLDAETQAAREIFQTPQEEGVIGSFTGVDEETIALADAADLNIRDRGSLLLAGQFESAQETGADITTSITENLPGGETILQTDTGRSVIEGVGEAGGQIATAPQFAGAVTLQLPDAAQDSIQQNIETIQGEQSFRELADPRDDEIGVGASELASDFADEPVQFTVREGLSLAAPAAAGRAATQGRIETGVETTETSIQNLNEQLGLDTRQGQLDVSPGRTREPGPGQDVGPSSPIDSQIIIPDTTPGPRPQTPDTTTTTTTVDGTQTDTRSQDLFGEGLGVGTATEASPRDELDVGIQPLVESTAIDQSLTGVETGIRTETSIRTDTGTRTETGTGTRTQTATQTRTPFNVRTRTRTGTGRQRLRFSLPDSEIDELDRDLDTGQQEQEPDELQFDAAVGAEILDIEADEELDDFEAQDPTRLRPVVDN